MTAFPLRVDPREPSLDLRPPDLADDLGRLVHDRRDALVRRVLGAVTRSLTIVLPAFNEAERIDPALDELFGYLGRREDRARDGALGAAGLPTTSTSSSSTTGAPTTPRRASRRDGRRRARCRASRCGCCACRTAARARPSGPACSPRPATSSSSPTPTWPRRPTRSRVLVAALAEPRRRARLAHPAGRLRHARHPARLSPAARQGVPPAGVDVGGRSGPGHAVRVQGVQPRAAAQDLFERQRITSIVFDVEVIYLARRRGYRLAIVPDPLVRQARVADARATGPRAARRLGPVPDPAHAPR